MVQSSILILTTPRNLLSAYDMIAEEAGISRVHLHRKMRELTNQTPHDLIRNIRMKKAANLLSGNNHSITEVMYACGFSNAASFSTMFRNLYGMSPRDYMKEHSQMNEDNQLNESSLME